MQDELKELTDVTPVERLAQDLKNSLRDIR